MGGAQHELTAHPFKCTLLGNVMQHHHGAENMALSVADRRQAIGQQSRLTVDLDAQIFRRPLQSAAAQHQLQLSIEFGALQSAAQPLAEPIGVPTQLTLRHGVEVFQMAFAVDHQQAVVDAVEYRLQTLLTGEQLVDIGRLMLAQGLGHDPEAFGQLVHFLCR